MSAAGEKVATPKWNTPLRVRQMSNDGTRAMDGSGWQWEITDRHGQLITDKLLREEAEHIVECVNSHAQLPTAQDARIDALEAREKVLREALTALINDVAEWCEAVEQDSSWDSWGYHYKELHYKNLARYRDMLATGAPKP